MQVFSFTRNDLIAYISLLLGASIGVGLFIGVFTIFLSVMNAPAFLMGAILLFCIPSLIAPALFFAFARNTVILFDSPRGLAWVISSVIGTTIKWTFLAPIFVASMPIIFLCGVVRGKVRSTFNQQFSSLKNFQIPAH